MKKEDRIIDAIKKGNLIGRFFAGVIAKREDPVLREQLKRSGCLQNEHDRLILPEGMLDELDQYHRLDTRKEWKKSGLGFKRKRQLAFYRLTAAAAVVVFFIIGGIGYFSSLHFQPEFPEGFKEIQPGSYRATLYIEDRYPIILQKDTIITLMPDSSVLIRNNQLIHSFKHADGKEEAVYHRLVVPYGGEYSVLLPDGTKVWLNADTYIRYPERFTHEERVVELEGEAFFEVFEDQVRPFIVKTTRSRIQVYGTSFNVHAYPGDSRQKITLEKGRVGVVTGGKEYFLRPDEQLLLAGDGTVEILQVDAFRHSSWRKGMFIFEKETLEDIMNQLARWYDVRIDFRDKEAAGLHFTGILNRYDDIVRLLEMIELTTHIGFTIEERRINIFMQK